MFRLRVYEKEEGIMGKFAVGSAMGFMLGASLMMMPAGMQIKRDLKRRKNMMKHWIKSM